MQSPKCPNGWRINGGCDFAADPSMGTDRACVVWLPHIDPTTVVVGPAPDEFIEARSISEVTLPLLHLTANGEHWLSEVTRGYCVRLTCFFSRSIAGHSFPLSHLP
jgi:hypothetical protein